MSVLPPKIKHQGLLLVSSFRKVSCAMLGIFILAGLFILPANGQSVPETGEERRQSIRDHAGTTQTPLLEGEAGIGRPRGQIQPAVLDFDGDHKTDLVLTRGTVGNSFTWYILGSTAGFSATSWGQFGFDFYVPGDYDGDGIWDIAVWRPVPGAFYILQSATNTLRIELWGKIGDDARISQDFDGDGKCDPAVMRPNGSAMTWYILRSSQGPITIPFGDGVNDLAMRGDYDGDGKADVAVYRTNTGSPANTFFVLPSSGGPVRAQTFGLFTQDQYFPADFDGDGKTDYAVFRAGVASPDKGTWYWIRSSDGSLAALSFGDATLDFPVPGDYDGDGTTDHAVWRRNFQPTFYQLNSTTGFKATAFGLQVDDPLAFALQVRN